MICQFVVVRRPNLKAPSGRGLREAVEESACSFGYALLSFGIKVTLIFSITARRNAVVTPSPSVTS